MLKNMVATSDNSNFWLFLVLLIVTGVCIVGFLIYEKRKNK